MTCQIGKESTAEFRQNPISLAKDQREMIDIASLIAIGLALGIGAASPGPSFFLVTSIAASGGRLRALAAAVGIGFGALLLAIVSLLGLTAILSSFPIISLSFRFAGGLYLVYLGIKIWCSSERRIEAISGSLSTIPSVEKNYFLTGLFTQLSNPKTIAVYSSVFGTFLPSTPSIIYSIFICTIVFIIETGWYFIVALAMSTAISRNAFASQKVWIDLLAGGVMVALGINLLHSALSIDSLPTN